MMDVGEIVHTMVTQLLEGTTVPILIWMSSLHLKCSTHKKISVKQCAPLYRRFMGKKSSKCSENSVIVSLFQTVNRSRHFASSPQNPLHNHIHLVLHHGPPLQWNPSVVTASFFYLPPLPQCPKNYNYILKKDEILNTMLTTLV